MGTIITKYRVTVADVTAEFLTYQGADDYRHAHGSGTEEITTVTEFVPDAGACPPVIWTESDHFISSEVNGSMGWTPYATGTNSQCSSIAGEPGHPGIISLNTGTTETGRATLRLSTAAFSFGSSRTIFEWCVRLPNLSSAEDNYQLYIGMLSGFARGDVTNGIYFRYNHALNGGRWTLCTAKNVFRTICDSEIEVEADTWYKLKAGCDGDKACFWINGIYCSSIITNIPNEIGKESGPCAKIEKSAGTTARSMAVDFFSWYIV